MEIIFTVLFMGALPIAIFNVMISILRFKSKPSKYISLVFTVVWGFVFIFLQDLLSTGAGFEHVLSVLMGMVILLLSLIQWVGIRTSIQKQKDARRLKHEKS